MTRPRPTPWRVLKWLLAVTAYYSGWLYLRERLAPRGIRILTYHRVQPRHLDDGMTISRGVFEAQLRHLKRYYQVISLDELATLLRQKRVSARRLVAVTFDDGYRDNYELAWPLLKRYETPATIFLTVGAVDQSEPLWSETLRSAVWGCREESVNLDDVGLGTWTLRSEAGRLQCFLGLAVRLKALSESERRRTLVLALRALGASEGREQGNEPMLTWEMVRELREGGITMGTHTVSHPILTQLNDDEARREIVESKRRIEEELGDSVRHFAYPNGAPLDWSVRVREIVRAAGLETAVTAIPGSNPVGQDLYGLRRIEVNDVGCTDPFGRFSRAMFEAQLVGFFGGWERQRR